MSGLEVERVDFIGVPVRDLARADAFYGETLGLRRNPNSGERWEAQSGSWHGSPDHVGLASLAPGWLRAGARIPN